MKAVPVLLGAFLSVAVALVPTASARGELIASESFDYAAGSLHGQNGGVGFTDAWNTSVWDVQSGTLAFPGMSTSYIQDTGTYPAEAWRSLSTTIDFDAEGVYYLSLLLNKTDGGATGSEPLMVYLAQGGTAAASLGITSSEKLMVGADKASLFAVGPAVPASTTVLAVLKLVTHAGAADQYFAWVFEPGETIPQTEPTTWDASFSYSVTGLVCNRLGFLSGNAIGAVDEIRLATTWGEVAPVPEPGTILLLSVGLVGMTFPRLSTRTGIAALGLCSLVLGCAKSDYPIAPVAGTVTVAGKPVANVSVQFQPIGQKGRDPGPGSVGVTDAAGHYQAKLIDADHDLDGAVVGRHRVRFATVGSTANLDLSGPVRSVLPPGQEGKEIEFDVPPGGAPQADFAFPMK